MDMDVASRWSILAACCFVNANPFATVLIFGTLYVPLLEKFNENRAKTATVQALLMGMTLCTGIIWGVLSKRYGVSKVMSVGSVLVPLGYIMSYFVKSLYLLYFTIGILSGIGTSIVHVCSSGAVARVFYGKGSAGRAIAIHNCAIGVGALAYPFLMDFLLHKYGINGTFLLIGGLNLNNIVVTLFIHYRIPHTKLENTQQMIQMDIRLDNSQHIYACVARSIANIKNVLVRMMTIHLIITVMATGIMVGCLNGFLVVILDLFTSNGFSPEEGLDSFTVLNACSIVGRLLPVLFQLKRDLHPLTTSFLCSVLGCAGLLAILKASDVSLIYVANGLVGIAIGGLISGACVALLQFARGDMFNTTFGLLTTVMGVVSSATGPLYGWMRDELQTYDSVIGMTTGILGVGALLCLIATCVPRTGSDEGTSDIVEMQEGSISV